MENDLIDPDLNYFDNGGDCDYYDTNSIYSCVQNMSDVLSFIHFNTRSSNKNLDEILVYLHSLKVNFSVIVLTETWMTSPDEWVPVAGYKAFHSIRSDRVGGGVTILVKDSIACESVKDLTFVQQYCEICTVKIDINGQFYNVIGLYRPPNQSVNDFNRQFFPQLGRSRLSCGNTVILGDFNIDLCPGSDQRLPSDTVNEFSSLHFSPKISIPTRVTDSTATCVDHIWTDCLFPCKAGVLPVDITDHFPVFLLFSGAGKPPTGQEFIKLRCHDQSNLDLFRDSIVIFDL
jgi:exonuclease III